jgi:Family of unknown function (DUF6049)
VSLARKQRVSLARKQRVSLARKHRVSERRGTALVVVLLLLGFLVASGGAGAPALAAAPLASLTLTTLDPAVGTPGEVLHVAGSVLTGRERLRNVSVALRLSRTPVNSRTELAGVAAGLTTGKDGDVITSQQVADTLPPGSTATFDLATPLNKLDQLTDFGVYVVGIQVTATHRTGVGVVAITRTFLPWVPNGSNVRPTGFSWLWPLVSHPTRLSNGTFADDSLATEFAPGGRLLRLSEAGAQLGQQVPLSWVVDPDLIDSATKMSSPNGYRVVSGEGTKLGTGTQSAADWLTQLKTATATSDVVALPYADPDLTALNRGGLGSDVVSARQIGTVDAAKDLGRPVTTDVAWPADGYTDRLTLALMARTGAQAVVLDDRALPTRLQLNYTPGGHSDIRTPSGTVTALLADHVLTELLGEAANNPVIAAQRFLAETAMITAELPSAGPGRVILIAPPRRWDPPQEFLDRLVAGTAAASWMTGTALTGMRTAPPAEVERKGLHYPAAQEKRELSAPYLTALRSQHSKISIFAAVLTKPDLLIPDLDLGVLRLESTWWRDHTEDRVNRSFREQSNVDEQLGSIHVQPGSYTFGSHSGQIPLTISNGVNQEVVVVLRLEPRQPRLRLKAIPNPIRIGAGRKIQEPVGATAVAGGDVVVDASLHTLGGTALPPGPVPISINITQYGTVALYITGIAAGVLFLAALARLARRALAARRSPPIISEDLA